MPPNGSQLRKSRQETPPPTTRGAVFVYLAIPVQIAHGAELTARTAHVRDLPREEAVADPEKARRMWDAIREQDTPTGTRLKLLRTVPGDERADEKVSWLMREGLNVENDILRRLTERSSAGSA